MSTYNVPFHDKIRKFPKMLVFLSCRKDVVGTQKRVRISHGKRVIGVRAIEVRLYYAVIRRVSNETETRIFILLSHYENTPIQIY